MKKLKFRFLDEKQIFGDKQLDILKQYDTKCAITDFAILLGGYVSEDFYTSEGISIKNRTGWWWTKTPYYNDARTVDQSGDISSAPVLKRTGGARPAILYSSIYLESSNKKINNYGILEVEFGEYPQDIVSEDLSMELENLYLDGTINQTGKSYTTDSVRYQDISAPFKAKTHIEYEYNGKKYIRIIGDSNCSGEVLSDGRRIKNGKVYWIEVAPIRWLVDEKKGLALCKKIVFSGIRFNKNEYNVYFKNAEIKNFMDNYFSKEIIPVKIKNKGNSNDLEEIPKEYTTGINASSEREVNIKLKGNNEKIIEILKKIRDEEIEVSLIPDKNQTRVRTHYGYRR